jgi:cysteate synthase
MREDLPGMFKYTDFLPVERTIDAQGSPVTFHSSALGGHLGLDNLFVIFNGYWPERGACMTTGSFKELEAPSVLARVPENHERTIVVASAGNTGRAFAHICSANNIPLFLVIPEESVGEIWSTEPYGDSVKLVLAGGEADYFDAITLAGRIVELDGYFPEGGAANVARRDGMATTLLDAGVAAGRIPDHYFQAVGSGTGGVAAWEAALRLEEDGGYGENRMKLHLAQNYPFVPMTRAWESKSRELGPIDEQEAKDQIHHIRAKVLSNRKPPYALSGGVFDVLSASDGSMYSVTNEEIQTAMDLFERLEGIDIHPAGATALGALMQAVGSGAVKKDQLIALNITGGGEKRVKKEHEVHYLQPFFSMDARDIHATDVLRKIEELVAV